MPEPQIIETSIITVKSTTKNQYGDLIVTTTHGNDIKIGEKRNQLFDLFQPGQVVKLLWAEYQQRKYVSRAELAEGNPQPTPQPKPDAPQSKITPPKQESSITDRDRRIEHMVWVKEVGEMIRMWKTHPDSIPQSADKKPQPWTTALQLAYRLEMLEDYGIKVEKEKPKE